MTHNTEVLAPEPPIPAAITTGIEQANKYHELAKLSMAQSCASMIMCGLVLEELKEKVEHGGWEKLFTTAHNRLKQSGAEPNGPTLGHFGFSRSSAQRYMAIAEAAKKNITDIRSLPLGTTPLLELNEDQRDLLMKSVNKKADGQTYTSLAKEWGLARKPKMRGGYHPAPEPDKPGGEESLKLAAKTTGEAVLIALNSLKTGPHVAFAELELLVAIELELRDTSVWLAGLLKDRKARKS